MDNFRREVMASEAINKIVGSLPTREKYTFCAAAAHILKPVSHRLPVYTYTPKSTLKEYLLFCSFIR